MNIIILGPPGSGKGTIGKRIAKHFKLTHFSSGAIIREEIDKNTEFGEYVKQITKRGDLVPDDKISGFMLDKAKKFEGIVFDGFPRTVGQARILDESNLEIDAIISLKVPEDVLKERLMNRWTCPKCDRVYNMKTNPPKEDSVCDDDGAKLYQRKDQREEVVKHRLQVYRKKTAELNNYYKGKDMYASIDGTGSPDEVFNLTLQELDRILGE